MFLPRKNLVERINRFLDEDLGQGDTTTSLLIPDGIVVEGEIIAKEKGVIAGMEEVKAYLESQEFQVEVLVSDGTEVREEAVVLRIEGNARMLLSMERTLLNILTRMSGIATMTHRIVDKVRNAGFKTRVACTRKVAPGLLYFDKKAVMIGGGDTHRLHLDDLVLIKDNHLTVVGNITSALERARETLSFSKKIEIEVPRSEEALEAAKSGAAIIMLDNFSPEETEETLLSLERNGLRNKVLIEVSGGISEENVLEYASTGVDIVSLGELTDSVKSLDMSLEIKIST